MFASLAHIGIMVTDMERSLNFYTETLSLQPVGVRLAVELDGALELGDALPCGSASAVMTSVLESST